VRPYGLTTAPKSDHYAVIDDAPKSQQAGDFHGRRHRIRQLQAKRERARVRSGLKEQEP